MTTSSPGSTSRTYDAPTMSSAAVSDATTQPRSRRPMTSGPDAVRVAAGVQRVLVDEDEAEGAAQPRQHVEGGGLEGAVGVVGEQGRDERGVGGVAAGQLTAVGVVAAAAVDQVAQLGAVGEVAVVRQGDRAAGVAAQRGLGVLPGRAAGRGVAAVADREVAAQRRERALVEHLGHQPHVLVDEQSLAVGGGDAGRLLPAVLQGVEPVVGELGDVLARGPDAEDTTGVLRPLLAGEQVVGQASVSAWHDADSPTPPLRSGRRAGPREPRSRPPGARRARRTRMPR